MLSPFNLELLSTETNRAQKCTHAHAHARAHAHSRQTFLTVNFAALVVSDVGCKRTGYGVLDEKKKTQKNKERCKRVRGGREGGGEGGGGGGEGSKQIRSETGT